MSTSLIHFLSHPKNAQTARILVIEYFPNKHILPFLDILQDFGYIRGYRLLPSSSDSKTFHKLEILLKYKNHKPAITRTIPFSKPSRRFYARSLSFSSSSFSNLSDPISSFMQGIFIISTSQGLMSHFTAHKLNIGGEVICHVR